MQFDCDGKRIAQLAALVSRTRRLAIGLDDDELAAAIAHELGHLTGRGDALPLQEAERQADQLGIGALQEIGISADAMIRMLRKVSARAKPGLLHPLQRRITILETANRIASVSTRP